LKSIEIILYVANQEKSKQFYSTLFGLSPITDVQGMTEFKLSDNLILGLMPNNNIAKIISPTLPHPNLGNGIPRCELYLHVEQPARHMAKAQELGGKLISNIQQRNWGAYVGYVSDLDGHVLAFAKT
jgi:predicted enzyme related to lactoylglutathione lyase